MLVEMHILHGGNACWWKCIYCMVKMHAGGNSCLSCEVKEMHAGINACLFCEVKELHAGGNA